MYNKKSLFITFEGIEGSGKSYQCRKLYQKLRKNKIPVILTREPGGTLGAEKIRDIILKDYFYKDKKNQFGKYTDTLLYLAARNEHVENKIKPAMLKKKIVLCDRFTDSTLAYQVYGKGVDRKFVDFIHKYILDGLKPNLTFLLTVNLKKAIKRIKKRRKQNRYDKFSKLFYKKVQNYFIKIAKSKKRYVILDNSNESKDTEKMIYNKVIQYLK